MEDRSNKLGDEHAGLQEKGLRGRKKALVVVSPTKEMVGKEPDNAEGGFNSF